MIGKRGLLVTTGTLLLFLFSPVLADRVENVSEQFPSRGAEKIEINADFSAGKLIISPEDMDEAAKFEIEYDSRYIKYFLDYDTKGETGILDFGSKTRHSIHNGDEIINDWEVKLSTRYLTEMTIDMGACEADIDLGGIPLTDLKLEIGAADGSITFSKKNPERMEDLDINIGASSIEISELGNANFEYMNFDCGAASCKVDFFGDWEGSSEVDMNVGVGSAKIIIPRDLEVRIITDDDSWFSSVDFHHDDLDEVRDGVFETANFRQAKTRLMLKVDVGMGSVDFYFK